MGYPTVDESITHSDLVVTGNVLSVFYTNNFDSLGLQMNPESSAQADIFSEFPICLAQIKIEKWFKGNWKTDTLFIATPSTRGACGISFKIGESYLIYASNQEQLRPYRNTIEQGISQTIFWTNQCTRTQVWNPSEENQILKVLNSKRNEAEQLLVFDSYCFVDPNQICLYLNKLIFSGNRFGITFRN